MIFTKENNPMMRFTDDLAVVTNDKYEYTDYMLMSGSLADA